MKIFNFPYSFFPQAVHNWFFFAGIAMTAVSMPNSEYFMSVGQFVLAGNWIIEFRYRQKIKRFINNKAAIVFTIIFLLHILAMFWSTDTSEAWRDIRKKLPFLTLTFMIASAPPGFNKLKSHWVLMGFTLSVFITTVIGYLKFQVDPMLDARELSPFLSHIRFSLMIVFAIFLLIWLVEQRPFNYSLRGNNRKQWILRTGAWLISVWLLFFLIEMRVLSGFFSFMLVGLFLTTYLIFQSKNKLLKIGFSSMVVVSLIGFFMLIGSLYSMVFEKDNTDLNNLPQKTEYGNSYHHGVDDKLTENGNLVYLYIQHDELKEAWNKRSNIDFDDVDNNGQLIRFTIYRYMSSLGLRKDRNGVEKLTDEDIQAIENGIGNHYYIKWPGLITRFHQTIWEVYKYQSGYDPTGHSFTQRIEYWRAAWEAIKEKPLLGWGTGDVMIAQNYGFDKINTPLDEQARNKPHNQFLYFTVVFGIVGLIIIIYVLFYVIFKTRSLKIPPNAVFMVIILASFLIEDTLQTQAGLTFFTHWFLFFNFVYTTRKDVPKTFYPEIND